MAPAEQPEPDAERFALRAPGVTAEVRHRRDSQHGVADQEHTQRSAALDPADQLQPDDDREPDHGRPAAQSLWVDGILAARKAKSTGQPGQAGVDGRERVEPRPGGTDQRAEQGQPDPAVHPQKERRHVAVAGSSAERLDDDPQPGQQADRAQAATQPARHATHRGGRVRARRGCVVQDHEGERHRHGQCRPADVHDQRQWRLVALVQRVGKSNTGPGQQQRRPADGRGDERQP